MTLGLAVFWGFKLSAEQRPYRLMLLSLAVFSWLSRSPVLLLWWVLNDRLKTKTWELGTHYDVFENWGQAAVGQLVFGPFVQIIPGALLGFLTLGLKRRVSGSGNDMQAGH